MRNPAVRPPYIQTVHKNGATFLYFRKPGQPRVRLPNASFGSAVFRNAYKAAATGRTEDDMKASRRRRRPQGPEVFRSLDGSEYEQMMIDGLYLGVSGSQRGLYYVRTDTGMRRLKSAINTKAMVSELRKFATKVAPPCDVPMSVRQALIRCRARAATRAKKMHKGPFSITLDDLEKLFVRQNGKCAITGLPLSLHASKSGSGKRNPWIPSIDRLDNDKGYTLDNIRLTSVIANLALGDFDLSHFYEMCAGALANRDAGG